MKLEFLKVTATNVKQQDAEYILRMAAITSNENSIKAYCTHMGYPCPEIGQIISYAVAEPAQKDGLVAATQEDYEQYGERWARGDFKIVADKPEISISYEEEMENIISSMGGDAAFWAHIQKKQQSNIPLTLEEENARTHLVWHNRADDEWLAREACYHK